jgi:hypothetical protein
VFQESVSFQSELQVLAKDGTQKVGVVTKQWTGLAKEFFTVADNFGMRCTFYVQTKMQK